MGGILIDVLIFRRLLISLYIIFYLLKRLRLVLYKHSYLLNRKQCFQINDILGKFIQVISAVLLDSIVRSILFSCFFNQFYYFIKNATVNKFADGNTLITFAQSVRTLIAVLESESSIAIDWFEANKISR